MRKIHSLKKVYKNKLAYHNEQRMKSRIQNIVMLGTVCLHGKHSLYADLSWLHLIKKLYG